MNLVELFVRNPVKVTVGFLLLTLFGIISVLEMPKQLTPEVQTPTISIQTRWRGASPQEVEQEIIQEQEEQLQSVEGITKMSSESTDSSGTITLEFQVGTNMEEALLKVNSRLQQVPEYPEEADEPIISTSNSSDSPIAWFILSAKQPTPESIDEYVKQHPEFKEMLEPVRSAHNPGLALLRLRTLAKDHPQLNELMPPDIDVPTLRRFAEDNIESMFERVAGVANSNVIGGLEDEMQVVIDPQLLAARELTIADVRRVLRGQNQDTSAGDFWEGKRRWVVRTLGQFDSPEEVSNQLLAVHNGAPVYVRDVAEVRPGYKKPDGLVRRFGTSSIAINVLRETGANVLDVMVGLQETKDELNERLLYRRGLQLAQVYDETEYIYSAIGLVQQNIFVGGALTMIVLMLFLHRSSATVLTTPLIAASALAAAYLSPWYFVITVALIVVMGFLIARGALVVGLAIPTSIVGTFLMLQLMGRSLNVISLAGLAFAVGMLVDNAVVVLENIYRRHSQGESPLTATVRGTQEVWGAVVASTLTTIAVFLPVVFVQEEAGQLFRDIALAISSAVALSLLVSVSLIPTATARLFRSSSRSAPAGEGQKPRAKKTPWVVRRLDQFGSLFVGVVVGINSWVQRGIVRRLTLIVLLIGASLGGSYLFWPKVEYLPTGNRNLVFGILLPPPGYNLDQLMEIGEFVEADLRPYWDVDPGSPEAAKLDFPVMGDFFFVARGRMVFLGVRAADPLQAAKMVGLVRKVGSQIPGTFCVAKQSSLFDQGLSAGRTIDVEITGPELTRLVQLGGGILGQVMQNIPNTQAIPKPSLDLSSPEVHIKPKLLQTAEMGVTAADLGYTVNALVDGAYACDYFVGGDKIDLTIIGQERFVEKTQDIEALPVATPLGQLVPLGALANVKLSSGPEQINHRERMRAITIEVSPPSEVPLEDAMQTIEDKIVQPMIDSGALEGGYRITLAGTADKLTNTWKALYFNFILALIITYLLMAALFESWLYPFVIILSVPLGAVGGILGLSLLNRFYFQPLDVLTMLGFVILIGTVVNNAILIVHQSLNHMREENLPPRDAILASVRSRIRPIFMTTMTTVLGLLPLVLFPGAGSELYRGLGSVVLGGLIVSTVFTLFLVPTVFSVTLELKQFLSQLFWPNGQQPLAVEPVAKSIPAPEEQSEVTVS